MGNATALPYCESVLLNEYCMFRFVSLRLLILIVLPLFVSIVLVRGLIGCGAPLLLYRSSLFPRSKTLTPVGSVLLILILFQANVSVHCVTRSMCSSNASLSKVGFLSYPHMNIL